MLPFYSNIYLLCASAGSTDLTTKAEKAEIEAFVNNSVRRLSPGDRQIPQVRTVDIYISIYIHKTDNDNQLATQLKSSQVVDSKTVTYYNILHTLMGSQHLLHAMGQSHSQYAQSCNQLMHYVPSRVAIACVCMYADLAHQGASEAWHWRPSCWPAADY